MERERNERWGRSRGSYALQIDLGFETFLEGGESFWRPEGEKGGRGLIILFLVSS